ncbi:recombinase family protein [Micromonospora sp. Llam0]|uniref:recombinase family protein n=1 Tax=Micromonospora sp. Llam0 TaxID=2485143 RepID=UPI00272A5128|nr:recombinase family protein [Micromonospora sp. Llam0]
MSDLRVEDLNSDGESKGLVEHERLLRDRAGQLGWTVGEVIVENDMANGKPKPASAFKRRKIRLPDGSTVLRVIRPGFTRLLDRVRGRRSQAVLAVDLDRAVRDPRDLEDMIDAVQETGANAQSLSGSLRFTDGGTDSEITLARVMVTMANKASRDTGRRVRGERLRQAMHGQWGGGRRPFGFCGGPPPVGTGDPGQYVCSWHGGRDCQSGVTRVEVEASVIEDCSQRLLQGASLRSLAAELRAGSVSTVGGAAWSAEGLRDILLRPRNAGFMVYGGQILEGVVAPWKPIVDPAVFFAVRDLLTDPSRRSGPGAAARWVGSGIYRCGVCLPPGVETERPVTVHVTVAGRAPRYTCKARNHLARNQAHVDAAVFAHVVYAVTHPRAFELLAEPAPQVDVEGLRAQRAAIQQRVKRILADELRGLETREYARDARREAAAMVAEIDAQLHANVGSDPLSPLVNAPDPVAAWRDAPLADKRVVIDRLMTVTILPSGRKGRGFDPTTVRIEPKHDLGTLAAV